ncbi:PREDICTED: zinc finger protein VAR3, chloroplastic [Nelumbo nucifera]|uniref:Zinc finger protein VAR3, chloroplastic n=1 Tax=Nelumbo nucifera TaxID=4432 RepID=A0A1U7Z090_NELNU|nr:PREDICTED: zinc finger protein VAR3, chloroplastic [Nelumbo nucifera]
MGSASKFIMLLSTPFPFLCSRPSTLRLARYARVSIACFSSSGHHSRLSSNSRPRLASPIKVSEQIHTQTSSIRDDYADESVGFSSYRVSHPWLEWSKLVENLKDRGYFDCQSSSLENSNKDEFSVFEDLPEEFVRAASACLSFARDKPDILGSLSRKDMEVIVENGSPFLFKNSLESARRMRSFLGRSGSDELEIERANMVDLMRFLLSYACNPLAGSDGNNLNNRHVVESSVRNLLKELANLSGAVQESDLSGSTTRQFSNGYRQTTRPLGQNTEMKRGDWICPKCSFMNFARNMKCLECNEARPKRQLTGGEWECPQCAFFNYGRNIVCLRCDCKRPEEMSFGTTGPRSGLGYGGGTNLNKADIESKLATGDEKAERWFSNVSQLDNTPDLGAATADEDFPEIMPLRKGVNRFVVSTRKTPLERRLANAQHRRNLGNELTPEGDGFQTGLVPESTKSSKSDDNLLLSVKLTNQTESKGDKEEEKSERWFKKVSELHRSTGLPSAMSDRNFPEIMPKHKGENQFVVSKDSSFLPKKNDSSLTPPYRRGMAKEQSSNTNFVRFVPFPPDYFAKKDTHTGALAGKTVSEKSTVASAAGNISNPSEKLSDSSASPHDWETSKSEKWIDNRQTSGGNWNADFPKKSFSERKTDTVCGAATTGNSTQLLPGNPQTGGRESWNSGSWRNGTEGSTNLTDNPAQPLEDPPNYRDSLTRGVLGKSLEGSCVTEPDPLDMSQEAKEQRWFRRVQQIKDISELSNIPDEDFPEIMPMRKGVNRFVVSKRKTPLERRLTSPQYRRNLPIINSDPVKENDAS